MKDFYEFGQIVGFFGAIISYYFVAPILALLFAMLSIFFAIREINMKMKVEVRDDKK